jgi:Ribbon-helix-helix protein, copG family
MATGLKQIPLRLDVQDAERLARLAHTHEVSQAQLIRCLIRWLNSPTIGQAVDRSRGLPR